MIPVVCVYAYDCAPSRFAEVLRALGFTRKAAVAFRAQVDTLPGAQVDLDPEALVTTGGFVCYAEGELEGADPDRIQCGAKEAAQVAMFLIANGVGAFTARLVS
jgi:hypothetical protein